MMLSTRADPPKFLNLTKGPNHKFKQFLLTSPLPSPSLPSILPRHGKKPPKLDSKRIVRVLCWLAILISVVWILQRAPATAFTFENLTYQSADGREYQMMGALDVPSFASPVAVTDKRGTSRWTVSIPSNLHFPLSASDYDDV